MCPCLVTVHYGCAIATGHLHVIACASGVSVKEDWIAIGAVPPRRKLVFMSGLVVDFQAAD